MSDRQTTAFILASLTALVLWLNNTKSPYPSASGGIRTRLMDLVDTLLGRPHGGGSPGSGGVLSENSPGVAPFNLPPIKTKIGGVEFKTDGSISSTDAEEVRRKIEAMRREGKL